LFPDPPVHCNKEKKQVRFIIKRLQHNKKIAIIAAKFVVVLRLKEVNNGEGRALKRSEQ